MKRPSPSALAAAVLCAAVWGCDENPIVDPPAPTVSSVEVTPASALLASLGDTVRFDATARDGSGAVVVGAGVTWSSSDAAVLSVSSSGLATALDNGSAFAVAAVAGVTDSVLVTVAQVPVQIELAPGSGLITALGEADTLTASALDARGASLDASTIVWASSDSSVAEVVDGVVTARSAGTVTISATVGALTAEAAIVVDPWRSISSSTYYTCGVLESGATWCWGDPSRSFHRTAGVPGPAPVRLGAAADFTTVVTGSANACALDADGAAWCWGDNSWGQLGDGGMSDSDTPVAVAGGLAFEQLAVVSPVGSGGVHTCGITSDGGAWCWGLAAYGQLGIGPDISGLTPCQASGFGDTYCATEPVPVAGGLSFVSIGLEFLETCAVEEGTGEVWCWGYGTWEPSVASWPERFGSITAHFEHTCGVELSGAAYCWGSGVSGKLGNGTDGVSSAWPSPVSGGVLWSMLSAGGQHTCGVAIGGAAWCWGLNRGRLGRGDVANDFSNVPVEVAGGLTFTSISATGQSCGLTDTGAAWCWGENFGGQLGDGTTTARGAPIRVLDPGGG